VQARDRAGDHQALDLGGAFEDRVAAFAVFGEFQQSLLVRVRVRPVARDPARSSAL